MKARAIIHFDTPDNGLDRIAISVATLPAIERALRQAAIAGGRFVRIVLFDRASGQVVYTARMRQATLNPPPH